MGTDLTVYEKKWAADAERYASQEKVTDGSFVSIKAGVLTVGEDELPGNQMCVIVLDSMRENTFYTTKYNADIVTPPTCFAFGRDDDEMGPHPAMQKDLSYFEPQHHQCTGCPMNVYGSSDTGRGKACSNRRRLAILPAGYYNKIKGSRDFELEVFDDPKHYREAEMAFLKLPVTSVKAWSKYVNMLATELQRPPYAAITRIYVEPDPKTQFRVGFELIEEIPVEWAEVMMARHEEAAKGLERPYEPPTEEQLAPQGRLSRLRRGR